MDVNVDSQGSAQSGIQSAVVAEATPVPSPNPKFEATPFESHGASHAGSAVLMVAGLCGLAAACSIPFAMPAEGVAALANYGVRASTLLACGVAACVGGMMLRRLESSEAAMRELKHQISSMKQSSSPEEGADAVANKVAPAITSVVSVLCSVEKAVERVRVQVEQMGERFREHERANLGLAGSVDGLAARMERVSKEWKAPAAGRSSDDDFAPITRAIDSMSRDEHQRAAKLHEAVSGIQSALDEMESRVNERFAEFEKKHSAAPDSASTERLDGLDAMVCRVDDRIASAGGRMEKLEDSLVRMRDAMESQSQELRQSIERVRESMPSCDAIASAVAASMPAQTTAPVTAPVADVPSSMSAIPAAPFPEAAPSSERPVELAEGPRQSRTLLKSIDKLRSMRGA